SPTFRDNGPFHGGHNLMTPSSGRAAANRDKNSHRPQTFATKARLGRQYGTIVLPGGIWFGRAKSERKQTHGWF
ncbi:MAG TPA: hypothetical protein VKA19_07450, partial [Alphaproteobacteria bacterium]|nr:hypothetical protein [Alphaproteobacteria bacterium]